jgi:hypothetical protein
MESNRFPSSTAKLRNYKAGLVTPAQPTSSRTISLCSSTSFPTAKKRKKQRNRSKGKQEGVISAYREAIFLSLWFHGGVGLACASGHTRAPTKSCKLGLYDSGETRYMSCSCKSYVPRSGGGIRCGALGVLRVQLWCAPALIPLLAAAIL